MRYADTCCGSRAGFVRRTRYKGDNGGCPRWRVAEFIDAGADKVGDGEFVDETFLPMLPCRCRWEWEPAGPKSRAS